MNIYSNADIIKIAADGAMEREKALSQNLANINTPNYKRKDVSFQSELEKMLFKSGNANLKVTDEKHISNEAGSDGTSFQIKTDENISMRKDGNGTTLDTEMAEKAKNAILYNSLIGQISRKFNSLKYVIAEGGK